MIVGDASSRVHTDSLVVNGRLLRDPTPWDGKLANGYEEGQFDAITAQVQVTNGKLTIQPAWLAGALLPRINFIEIGKVGTTLDAATIARAKAAALKATQDTGKPKPKTPPVVKRNIWGTYVDELVSYTVKKPRKSAVRYFAHANHLYSVAAIISATGSVVERWSYNVYGVPTIKNSANATIAKSAVGNDRGFTGYKLDSETGLNYARARMYSVKLGRFISRDSLGYIDGTSLYRAYFVPLRLDPSGNEQVTRTVRITINVSDEFDEWSPVGSPYNEKEYPGEETVLKTKSCKKSCGKDGIQKVYLTLIDVVYEQDYERQKYSVKEIRDIKLLITSTTNTAGEINSALDNVFVGGPGTLLSGGAGGLLTIASVLSNDLSGADIQVNEISNTLVQRPRVPSGSPESKTEKKYRTDQSYRYGECE